MTEERPGELRWVGDQSRPIPLRGLRAEDQWRGSLPAAARVDFFGSQLRIPEERRFADIDSVQAYVDGVLSLIGVVTQWSGVGPVRVRERSGDRRAHYSDGVIALRCVESWASAGRRARPLSSTKLRTISSPTPIPPRLHTAPAFCGDEIRLVEIVLGPEAALLLRASFDGAGVPVLERAR